MGIEATRVSPVELPGCFNCLVGRGWRRLVVCWSEEDKSGRKGRRRDAEGDWAKGCSALLGYPGLASTAQSCSFCLSVNKRSSMDRQQASPAPRSSCAPFVSFFSTPLPLFSNAICSAVYFFVCLSLPRYESREHS